MNKRVIYRRQKESWATAKSYRILRVEKIAAIEMDLHTATEILEHLRLHQGSEGLIATQKKQVTELEQIIEAAKRVAHLKTGELALEQLELELLGKKQELLQQKVEMIKAM